ncbi:MAG: O-antigen ligase family protein, partial [Muriicola sp.]|nr:O-antigen ligase family protein [Muriicola sp.]
TKWFNVPLSFFYFKNLLQHNSFEENRQRLSLVVKYAFFFLVFNMILGVLGFGMAFYHHGFSNAVGTRGFIFAGNELTILVLALGFIIGMYFFKKGDFKRYLLFFAIFLVISFLITSKTVLGGVVIVFIIPVLASIRSGIDRKWINYLTASVFLGIPLFIAAFYLGITKSGIIEKIKFSLKRNDYDLLTVALSNRNNFIKNGWEVFANEFPILGKIVGYGQQYHLELSGHLAEVDFFSLLFSSGILGLLSLLLVICYWIFNANHLRKLGTYPYAKSVLLYLWFLIIAANLSGHVFGSGIAGFFIGMSLALMFYKNENRAI